jgi:hypothetical protein
MSDAISLSSGTSFPLTALPPEIILHICRFLDWRTLFALDTTCRYFHTVSILYFFLKYVSLSIA